MYHKDMIIYHKIIELTVTIEVLPECQFTNKNYTEEVKAPNNTYFHLQKTYLNLPANIISQ